MATTQAWLRLLSVAARRGLAVEEVLLPPAPIADLASAELMLGMKLHPDLRELYEQSAGLRRFRNHDREPSLPGFGFPSLKESVARTLRLREVAWRYWRPSWVQVFDDDYVEIFILDCSTGIVWYAWWEGDELHPVAPTLAAFFGVAAAAADRDDVRYQPDGDYFETPDGEVWEAPIKEPWTPT
ncbi:MAG: SMI1/KNR4 family protein [Propionibacteriaceae bacterium]|jgi:cell wall assembly regulator SMI1|nr:SMI1/KNR4 family protein [Propionibacteriaceae bacterium]